MDLGLLGEYGLSIYMETPGAEVAQKDGKLIDIGLP
jgi:hypothetical protein